MGYTISPWGKLTRSSVCVKSNQGDKVDAHKSNNATCRVYFESPLKGQIIQINCQRKKAKTNWNMGKKQNFCKTN